MTLNPIANIISHLTIFVCLHYSKKLLLHTRCIMRFLRETASGSEKSWLVIADVPNDDLLPFRMHTIVFYLHWSTASSMTFCGMLAYSQ